MSLRLVLLIMLPLFVGVDSLAMTYDECASTCSVNCTTADMNLGLFSCPGPLKSSGATADASAEMQACINSGGTWSGSSSATSGYCTSAKSAGPTPEELIQQCISQAQSQIASCQSQQSSTANTCSTETNSALSDGANKVNELASQVSTSQVQASCANMLSGAKGAVSSLESFKTSCSNAINSCTSACGNAQNTMDNCAANANVNVQGTSEYQAVTANSGKCSSLQSTVSSANSLIDRYNSLQNDSQVCKTDTNGEQENSATANATGTDSTTGTSATGTTSPTTAGAAKPANNESPWAQAINSLASAASAILTATPETTTTVTDCSSESMLTNTTCICAKDPTNAACGKTASASSEGLTASGGGVSTASTASSLDLNGTSPELSLNMPASSGGYDNPLSGKQGSAANVGGGSPGSGSGTNPTPNGNSNNSGSASTSNGFYGSSGGGGSASGNTFAKASSTSTNGNVAYASGTNSQTKTPDLRQFLPGGALDPKRKIAGMGGIDGITGPHSNIWQKVNNRYQVISNSLLP